MRYLLAILAICTAAIADEPVTPVIILPTIETAPQPQEDTTPKAVATLSEDVWYVVESKTPLIILSSPAGIVDVQPDTGPLKIKGKFADAPTKIEARVYSSPYLYFVNAVKPGTTELIIIPQGVTSQDDILRHALTVSGQGPKPPPDVVPDVDPEPQPQPVPPTGIRVLLLGDETASREQLNTLNSTRIVSWLDANCAKDESGRPAWRRWDRTTIAQPGMLDKEDEIWRKLWSEIGGQVTGRNSLIVVADTKVKIHPLPNPDDALKILNAAKEGN